MNRWKRESGLVEIRLMHAHNLVSKWHTAILEAAEALGLTVLYREYPNHHDGSKDRAWYVSAAHLTAVGGRSALNEMAERLHAEKIGNAPCSQYHSKCDSDVYQWKRR